ncbi:MAG: ABC transporter permease [Thermomicrobiales bacterium]
MPCVALPSAFVQFQQVPGGASMLIRLLQRILLLIVTVIATSSAIFVLIHAAGDPTQGFLPPGASPEMRAQVRSNLGLDDPIALQYARFIGRGLRGDFGDSWRDHQPALQSVLDRLPATLLLATTAIVLATIIGGAIAVIGVSVRSGFVRRGLNLIGLLGQAVPTFWLGTLFILIFAVRLNWLPSSGNAGFRSLILPALTLAGYPASMIARLLQSSLLEAGNQEYLRTARAKGLANHVVWLRHALPNALLPTLGFVGLQLGFMVGGTVVVESVFAYPGVGRLALQAASERDLPVVHAFAVVVAILIVVIGTAIDLLVAALDPRLRDAERMERMAGLG